MLHFVIFLQGDKNKFGDGGSDPSTQAGLNLHQSRPALVDHFARDNLSWPCAHGNNSPPHPLLRRDHQIEPCTEHGTSTP